MADPQKLDKENTLDDPESSKEKENISPVSSNPAINNPDDPESAKKDLNNPVVDKSPEGNLIHQDGRIELNDEVYYESTGFCFPTWKKWLILTVIFLVQVSMNINASIYGNAVTGLQDAFGLTAQQARGGQGAFLIAYAFGCELWAPFSEEFGRKWTLQLSLFLVNIWQIPCALAPNYATIIVCRLLGGLSSAGGSVTLGMVADLFEADVQQYAVLFVVLASVGGSVVGPIIGGAIEYTTTWHWVFWWQLIIGVAVQVLHLFIVPETRVTIMMDQKAKKLRKEQPEKYGNHYGPNEIKDKRMSGSELLKVWYRPFHFFFTEPIVLCLSLLSGFSDALIFTFLEAFTPVFMQWHFNTYELGLAFVPIAIGYIIAYFSFFPDIIAQQRQRRNSTKEIAPERRLLALLFEAPLETIGLFGFAFTSYGPAVLKGTNTWIAPMIFATLVGIANFAIYYTTVDYMVAAYGPYAASATGGNGFARDFLAGIAAFYSTPMFTRISPPHNLEWASMILALIAIVVTIPIYVFYWKGQWFRERSRFAQSLKTSSGERGGRRMSSMPGY